MKFDFTCRFCINYSIQYVFGHVFWIFIFNVNGNTQYFDRKYLRTSCWDLKKEKRETHRRNYLKVDNNGVYLLYAQDCYNLIKEKWLEQTWTFALFKKMQLVTQGKGLHKKEKGPPYSHTAMQPLWSHRNRRRWGINFLLSLILVVHST